MISIESRLRDSHSKENRLGQTDDGRSLEWAGESVREEESGDGMFVCATASWWACVAPDANSVVCV